MQARVNKTKVLNKNSIDSRKKKDIIETKNYSRLLLKGDHI